MHILLPLLCLTWHILVVPAAKPCKAEHLHVAIIGAGGYVGSELHEAMADYCNWQVKGFDRHPDKKQQKTKLIGLAAEKIPTSDLRAFHAVIYLGGLAGPRRCNAHTPKEVLAQNVDDLVSLASRMGSTQLLVFANTSAIATGTGLHAVDEEILPHKELDIYQMSMLEREIAMRNLSTDPGTPQLIGLRLGAVIGTSAGQVEESLVGPGLMLKEAYTTGVIQVHHPEMARPFLWMPDLVRAFLAILEMHKSVASTFAIYNLISFNTNMGALASAVAARTGARIATKDHYPAADVPVW